MPARIAPFLVFRAVVALNVKIELETTSIARSASFGAADSTRFLAHFDEFLRFESHETTPRRFIVETQSMQAFMYEIMR